MEPSLLLPQNTCKRGRSTKLQQSNGNVLGWCAPSLLEITLKKSFWPLPTNWSRRTSLLHLSLRVQGIMVSAVIQMLHQDLNTFKGLDISDPPHFVATSHLRGLLNTSISHHPKRNSQIRGNFSTHPISRNPGGLSNHLHFALPSNNTPFWGNFPNHPHIQ